ncbi:MAG: glycoside hydrolase, partial [Verrucomicrobia bacterium]
MLKPETFSHHIARFNGMADETITNFVSNAKSWNWLQKNIPLFECPDSEVEELYYFRWWSYRKHVVKTPKGFVITEFLPPVSHAGEFNTISCAAGFHLAEARWLRDDRYLNDYTKFWLRGNKGKPQAHFHKFSSWFAAAAYDRYLVNGDKKYITSLLSDLVADYRAWEAERQLTNGLFWQFDVRDAMEESISGSRTAKNIRPTINSYMFGNARAVAEIARLDNKPKLAAEFEAKAADLKRLVEENLWDGSANFFKVLAATTDSSASYVPSSAREELGFLPWTFDLPETNRGFDSAWSQLTDPQGFNAPFGLTTAERRHPQFRSHGSGKCEWDGAVWPFATSQTLYALANVLRPNSLSPSDGERAGVRGFPVSRTDYFSAFLTYVHSQHADGQPYIGEYLDEVTG